MAELSYRVCQFASTAVTSLLQGESRGAAAPSACPWGSCTNSSLGWGGLRPDLPLPGFLDTSVLRRWSLMSRSHTSFPSLCGMCPSADKTHLRSALSGECECQQCPGKRWQRLQPLRATLFPCHLPSHSVSFFPESLTSAINRTLLTSSVSCECI